MLVFFFSVILTFGYNLYGLAGGREASFNPTRLSSLSTVYEEGETFPKDFRRASSCSSSVLETLNDGCLENEEIKASFNPV